MSEMLLALVAVVALMGLGAAVLAFRRKRARPSEVEREVRVASLIRRSTDARRQSIRDEATGLYTPWYLDFRLNEEAARCKRYGHSMAVIVLRTGAVDLSGMSTDSWQSTSSAVAKATAEVIRNVDLSAALGPMEFAICLIQCDRTGAQRVLGRLLEQLPESDLKCETGIAVYPQDGTEPGALVELARGRAHPEVART